MINWHFIGKVLKESYNKPLDLLKRIMVADFANAVHVILL